MSGVTRISAADAAACAYVTDIRMKPGIYGPLAGQGVRYAENRILADARDAGANAIVYKPLVPDAEVTLIEATAYRCPV